MKIKSLILSCFFVIFFIQLADCQAVTYYPFNSVVSISSNPKRIFWMDFRFHANSYFTSLSTEISPMINIVRTEKVDYYVGGGVQFNFFNYLNTDPKKQNPIEGYMLNFGVRASPFAKAKGVQVVFELSPYAVKAFDLGIFRANLGLAYVFGKKNN